MDVHEAKTHLSRLLEAVEAGEDVVIARAGKPIARLVPVAARTEPRAPGSWRGRVIIAADFYETPDELITAFHGWRRLVMLLLDMHLRRSWTRLRQSRRQT